MLQFTFALIPDAPEAGACTGRRFSQRHTEQAARRPCRLGVGRAGGPIYRRGRGTDLRWCAGGGSVVALPRLRDQFGYEVIPMRLYHSSGLPPYTSRVIAEAFLRQKVCWRRLTVPSRSPATPGGSVCAVLEDLQCFTAWAMPVRPARSSGSMPVTADGQ